MQSKLKKHVDKSDCRMTSSKVPDAHKTVDKGGKGGEKKVEPQSILKDIRRRVPLRTPARSEDSVEIPGEDISLRNLAYNHGHYARTIHALGPS